MRTKFGAVILCLGAMAGSAAHGDAVTDWNLVARTAVVNSGLKTPPANRVMGLVHTAMYQAANSISREFPLDGKVRAQSKASPEAAVAAACRAVLRRLLPGQSEALDQVYSQVLARVPSGASKRAGTRIGREAAEAVLTARKDDGSQVLETYRPHAAAGSYVPTVIPAVPAWPQRKPWLMDRGDQFRPVAPPALGSEVWARDFNEVRELGGAQSGSRTEEQTAIALFWEATLPPIYHGVVHSVALQPNRTLTQNARLFALVTQATDDAMIAVFDAKYHFAFWRPVTAIRNADLDGNDATARVPGWNPTITTPMHPEYPCAHCVIAATVGTIIEAEIGDGVLPLLTTSSSAVGGATRKWRSVSDFIQEVSEARIYDGVHYRTSTEVGNAMGRNIGAQAIERFR